MAISKEYLNTLRDEMKKLFEQNNVGLSVGESGKKTGSFNIEKDKNIIHILASKCEKKRDGRLWFSSRITYNVPEKVKRIKKSPGSVRKLLEEIKKVYPSITNIIESESFLKKESWQNNCIPLAEKVEENARRLAIYAALKLFFSPRYGNKDAYFDEKKFKKIYEKLQSRETTIGQEKDVKNKVGEEEKKLSVILNAINTKPFVILSGISGTGKTQIARIISAGITQLNKNGE